MYRKNLVFAGACIGMLIFGMVFISLGTVTVFIQQKFGLDNLTAATLASSLPLGILAGSVVFGPITDRFGYKMLLVAATVLIIAAFELIAFAAGVSALRLAFFVIGFAGGLINGVTNALVADISSEKGSNLSLLGVFYGIGALGMPAITGALSRIFSYESVISSIGWALIIPLIFFTVIRFPDPKIKQGFPVSQAAKLLKDPLIIILGFVLFFESALEGITGNWTTIYLKSAGITVEKALLALSVHVASISAARLILSRILGKVDPLVVIYLSFALILGGAVTLAFSQAFTGMLIAMILLGLGFAAVFPIILGIVGGHYSSLSGTAFSLVIVMALAGNTLINYLTGNVTAAAGISAFPYIILICGTLMIIIFRIFTSIKKIKTTSN